MALQPRPWQVALARRQQASLLQLIREADEEVRRAVVKSAQNVGTVVRRIPGKNIGDVIRRAQYRQQQMALRQAVNQLWAEEVPDTIRKSLASATARANLYNEQVLAVLTRAVPASSALLADSLQRSLRTTLADVRSRFLNNVDLSPSVYGNANLMSGKVDDVVNEGISLGKSAREIADDVIDYIDPDVMGGSRYAAQRLGRTEINNAFHTSSTMGYAESPWVEGVKWNLSGSHPRPDECNDYAGANNFGMGPGIFPKDQVPFKPHPQCFCYTTALTMDPDEFADRLGEGDFDCGRVR